MIASKTIRRMNFALALGAGGMMVAGAAPAYAETTAPASAGGVTPTHSAAIAGPVSIDNGDTQFSQLFASWKSLDEGVGMVGGAAGAIVFAPTTSVSVPSRMPLGDARMTSGYGMRYHPVTGGRSRHKGIDLAAPTGTPVYATADGTVKMSQRYSSYGLYVSIDHGAELETRYAHLSGLNVSAGASVRKGDLIGFVGSTGRSTGPHLHYEVRVDGQAVNPVPYMAETAAQEAFVLASGTGGQGGPQ